MDTLPTHGPVRGFTLIEVAVVVAVIAALMTLGLNFLNAQLTSSSYATTKKRAELIKEALTGYLGAYRRLPCPIAPGSIPAAGGKEPSLTGTSCPEQHGVIPYASIGLSREIAEDGWGNLFSYRIYVAPSAACPGGRNWGDATCFGEGKSGDLIIDNGTIEIPDPVEPAGPTVIAVIVSHGPNGLGAYVAQGTPNQAPVICEEAYNARNAANKNLVLPSCPSSPPAPDTTFYRGEQPEIDDVVTYLTAGEALQSLVRQGTVKSAIAKVNDDLQLLVDMALGVKRAGITFSSSSTSPLEPSSGCEKPINPTPPTSLTVEFRKRLDSIRDSWGNPYVVVDEAGSGTPGKFPICIYSRGRDSAGICDEINCIPTLANPSAICKSIDKFTFDTYLAKVGSSACP